MHPTIALARYTNSDALISRTRGSRVNSAIMASI
jgi:hypothetical protein